LTPTHSPIPIEVEKVQRIVIDSGNGGKDFGAIGYDKKLMEKDINLKIAKKVVDLLKREPGLDVLMTRHGDDDISDK
jgi:N-acetylmuramoyl-L-alanine amidase